MSYRIETLSGSKEPEFGFWSADVTRVRLGELPAMSLEQFCDYATNSVIISYESATVQERTEIRAAFEDAIAFTKDLPVREENPLKMPRLRQMAQTAKDILDTPYGEIEINRFITEEEWHSEMAEALNAGDKDKVFRLAQEMIIAANIARGTTVEDYNENPFRVLAHNVDIAGRYEVSFTEFAYFTSYILKGGFLGWSSDGIPQKARESLAKIQGSILEVAVNGTG